MNSTSLVRICVCWHLYTHNLPVTFAFSTCLGTLQKRYPWQWQVITFWVMIMCCLKPLCHRWYIRQTFIIWLWHKSQESIYLHSKSRLVTLPQLIYIWQENEWCVCVWPNSVICYVGWPIIWTVVNPPKWPWKYLASVPNVNVCQINHLQKQCNYYALAFLYNAHLLVHLSKTPIMVMWLIHTYQCSRGKRPAASICMRAISTFYGRKM